MSWPTINGAACPSSYFYTCFLIASLLTSCFPSLGIPFPTLSTWPQTVSSRQDPLCWSNGAGLPLKSRASKLPQEGLSALPVTVYTNPSHRPSKAKTPLPAETSRSWFPPALFPLAPGQSPPSAPTPFSVLPQHPAASVVPKSLRTCHPLSPYRPRDPRTSSSMAPSSVCVARETEPTPAVPGDLKLHLFTPEEGSCGFSQPNTCPAVALSTRSQTSSVCFHERP